MRLIDVHAHLEDSKFAGDLGFVIERFKNAGGQFILNSGTDSKRNYETLKLVEKYDVIKASFGMYPIGDYSDIDGDMDWIEKHSDVCVAIGEIGLDFDRGREDFYKQKKLFVRMLGLAKKINKTVVIHSRKAELEVVEILEDMGMKKVVMHCFCGKRGLIRRCVENGWDFSVPPVIKRWDNFKMLVKIVPIEQLLTETDSPYLGVDAKVRNEPMEVGFVIKAIAKIKELSQEDVAEQIFNNAKRLFEL